jgi:hypothetical protein
MLFALDYLFRGAYNFDPSMRLDAKSSVVANRSAKLNGAPSPTESRSCSFLLARSRPPWSLAIDFAFGNKTMGVTFALCRWYEFGVPRSGVLGTSTGFGVACGDSGGEKLTVMLSGMV